jgi:hypothetical protein
MKSKDTINISIDMEINKAIRKLSTERIQLDKVADITFKEFDSLSGTYNYILKLGLIKLDEMRSKKNDREKIHSN